MPQIRRSLRNVLRWSHRWLGLAGGTMFCLLAVTGAIVTFRPQIANLLSPPAQTSSCVPAVDWNRAGSEVEAFGHSHINRVYGPTAPDTRYRFRMMTDREAIFDHVIYDACAGKVTGTANLAWMDWTVDLHHNLLAGHTGRLFAGWIGLGLFLSSLGGVFLWLLSNPSMQRVFHIRGGAFMPRDLHVSGGIIACSLLLLATFSSLWLCFPQIMRGALSMVTNIDKDTRAPKPRKPAEGTAPAGLGDIMAAALRAIPNGSIREIRMPDGYGNVQVRMWRPGDFRSLGNNVVTVDNATANVAAIDLYEAKPAGNRIVQAMAGLHYGEWGGLAFRSIYSLAGLVAGLLFITGFLLWWLPKRRASLATARASAQRPQAAVSSHS